MKTRSHSGFTIVELLIVVMVIAILAGIILVGYNGIRVAAMNAAAKSDLQHVSEAMQIALIENGMKTYPATIPPTVKPSPSTQLTLKWSGVFTKYTNLTAVQNGVLLSTICQNLIDEGLGKGLNQGGQTNDYVTGCGNWNNNSMQVTGWTTKVWNTPLSSQQLLDYANAFTTSDTWNASQAPVTKNFYTQLVQRLTSMGGSFPVTSFWDSWANSSNGGVQYQNLPSTMTTRTSYCVEATLENSTIPSWHIGEDGTIAEGPCQA